MNPQNFVSSKVNHPTVIYLVKKTDPLSLPCKRLAEIDLVFCEEGAKSSSGSLKQGVWGTAPQNCQKLYKLFNF